MISLRLACHKAKFQLINVTKLHVLLDFCMGAHSCFSYHATPSIFFQCLGYSVWFGFAFERRSHIVQATLESTM